jgi:hypothetical protein
MIQEAANMPDQENGKRKLHRSPNYPAFGLAEAIEKLRLIYKQEKRAVTTGEVVMTQMGHKPDGRGYRALSALKQYGLLEEIDGKYRVSDRGFTVLHVPEGSPEKAEALKQAALGPALFRELVKNYGDELPSDVTLKSYLLLEKHFNPIWVDQFIRIFRGTFELAKMPSGGYNLPLETRGEDHDMPSTQVQAQPKTLGQRYTAELERGSNPEEALVKAAQQMRGAPLLAQTLVVSIPRDFKVEISVRGDELRKEDLAKIKSQFNRWIEGLEEAFEE